MKRCVYVILLTLALILGSCSSSTSAPSPPTATTYAGAPISSVVPPWAKPVIPYSNPPAPLALNQPYQGGPIIIAVTKFDENVDPQTPDIKNSAIWTPIPGYRWVGFVCVIENSGATPFAPNFDLAANQQLGDGTGDSFLVDAQVVNGMAAPTGTNDPKYAAYMRFAAIPAHSVVTMRVYFFLQDSGNIVFGIYPEDPTLSEDANNQNFRPIHFFTIMLHPVNA